VRETLNVLLPISCPGCGEPDTELCLTCRDTPLELHRPRLALRRSLRGVPTWALGYHEGTWAALIGAWKDGGRFRLVQHFAPLVCELLERLARQYGWPPSAPIVIVPVPGSWWDFVRRGVEPTRLLARHIARLAYRCPALSLESRTLLTRTVRSEWRSVLARRPGSGGHRSNRTAQLHRPPDWRRTRGCQGAQVVLLDDVIRTGASVETAAAALHSAGATVIAVVCLSSHSPSGGSPGGTTLRVKS